jgi:hypothetical protein
VFPLCSYAPLAETERDQFENDFRLDGLMLSGFIMAIFAPCAICGTARWHPVVTEQSLRRAYIGFGYRATP